MRYLVDTHALIWFMNGDKLLSDKALDTIKDSRNSCLVSIACLWEMAIKHSIGKLEIGIDYSKIRAFLANNNLEILPLEFHHLQKLLSLEFIHRDPFDRVITAQAIAEDLTIITIDKDIVKYPVKCLW